MEIPEPFQEPHTESPGEKYQKQASEAADFMRLFGFNMTLRGVNALAILLAEIDPYLNSLEKLRRN